jgi:type II secretory pathway pseudopilin PulG
MKLSAFSFQPSANPAITGRARQLCGCVAAGRRGGSRQSKIQNPKSKIAFTLIELLVSLAVLVLALSVVGTVFSITTKTAGQAAAYSETQSWVRQLMDQLQADLDACEPSKSILVMVGRTQAAALTENDRQAKKYYRVLLGNPANVQAGYDPDFNTNVDPQYSDPRADILMFFANRPTLSQAPPPLPTANTIGEAAANGAKLSPIQVVYGHAALGQADPTGTAFLNNLKHIDAVSGNPRALSALPGVRWQLARRAVILDTNSYANKVVFTGGGFGMPGIGNEWQRITRFDPDHENALAGDVATLDLNTVLRGFGPNGNAGPVSALFSPYGVNGSGSLWASSVPPGWGAWNLRACVEWQLYNGGVLANHHVATVLEQVPVALRGNLGLHALPACVWFQVEFLMPEDPRNSADYTPDATVSGQSTRFDMPRWTSVDPNSMYVFVPDTAENRNAIAKQVDPVGKPLVDSRLASFARLDQNSSADASYAGVGPSPLSQRIIRLWPYAIRITARAFDPQKRLDQPIVRSLVHRFD